LQGGDQVLEKNRQIIVISVQRKPGDGLFLLLSPDAQQCGFPKPRWGGDQGQFTGERSVQAIDQVLAVYVIWPGSRTVELGGQN
jgi:hypothetical protein